MPDTDTKLVIVARKDLKLSPGKLAAQVGHAAVNASDRARNIEPNLYLDWLNSGQKKVVVAAKSQEVLFETRELAEGQGLVTSIVSDAGHTELPPGTVTCLAVGPGPGDKVDKVTGDLPLY